MSKIQLLIVDDSPSVRSAYRMLLRDDPAIDIVAALPDAFAAAQHMKTSLPDVMLLDLEMPRMDGLTFLGKVMAQRPLPVIVCSSHTDSGSKSALRALELGAVEVINKPRMASAAERQEAQIRLGDSIRAAVQARRAIPGKAAPAKAAPLSPGPKLTADAILPAPRANASPRGMKPVIAIGSSTGGTEALAALLPALPADTPPIVIMQHMPEKFTLAFARRLDGLCRISVSEAKTGDRPRPGTALIAPGNQHLLLQRQGKDYVVEIRDGPYVARHRPSVDVLFRSTASAAGSAALGVILTGMGDDGARGMKEMCDAGATTWAQDEASSIVWGMPGEAVKMGAAERTLPLDQIAGQIGRWSSVQCKA